MKLPLLCLAFSLSNSYSVFIAAHPSRPRSVSPLARAMIFQFGPYTLPSASPENLLEMQILEPHCLSPAESETLGVGLSTLF